MKKEVEVMEKKSKTEYYCDICGKQFSRSYWQGRCDICKKDVCRDCAVASDYITELAVDSDYPSIYCKPCWFDGEPFREELAQLVTKFETEKSELYARWGCEMED